MNVNYRKNTGKLLFDNETNHKFNTYNSLNELQGLLTFIQFCLNWEVCSSIFLYCIYNYCIIHKIKNNYEFVYIILFLLYGIYQQIIWNMTKCKNSNFPRLG